MDLDQLLAAIKILAYPQGIPQDQFLQAQQFCTQFKQQNVAQLHDFFGLV